MIEALFNRVDGTACFNEVAVTTRGKESAIFKLCRALVDAGAADDAIAFVDERGNRCLTISSLHKAAKMTATENDKRGPHFAKWAPNPLFAGATL